jgi:hypothetical protein
LLKTATAITIADKKSNPEFLIDYAIYRLPILNKYY